MHASLGMGRVLVSREGGKSALVCMCNSGDGGVSVRREDGYAFAV